MLGLLDELSLMLYELKRFEEVESLDRWLWQTRERILGLNDPKTLQDQANLCADLSRLERYDEAESLRRQIWQVAEHESGKDHPSALDALHQVALVIGEQKKFSEEEALHRQIWLTRQRVLGNDHPQTLSSQHEIGRALLDSRRLKEAEPILQAAYEATERVQGDLDFATLESLNSLLLCTIRLDQAPLALELAERFSNKISLLPVKDRKNFPWVSQQLLAEALYENGRDRDAEQILRRLLARGIVKKADAESYIRFKLAVMETDTKGSNLPLPSLPQTAEHYFKGRRFLDILQKRRLLDENRVALDNVSTSHESNSANGLSPSPQAFVKDLVAHSNPNVVSIETAISPIFMVSTS